MATELLVFGGTSEGRRLVEWLAARGTCHVVACTATAYGASLLAAGDNVEVLEGPLSAEAKRRLMETHDVACIVDATHPYALHISDSIAELAVAYGCDLMRTVRDSAADVGDLGHVVASAQEAARYLAGTTGNVLLTTGSKDLRSFTTVLPDFAQRLYVRILPVAASLERARELGIPTSHVIAMQGPFSTELNCALIREFDVRFLVTKQSGPEGGFDQKLSAARSCGIELVVIQRPRSEQGVSLGEAMRLLEERYGC